MRRLPLVLGTALLAVTGAAGAAPATFAQQAPAGSPHQLIEQFVAAANARSPQVSPCALMTRELRERVAVRELLTHDPVVSEPFGPDDVTRLCDAYLLREAGGGLSGGRDWLGTRLSGLRVVRERGELAQLRARVVQRFPSRSVYGSDEVVNLFVVREEGVWRLASLTQLLPLDLAGGLAPSSLPRFARERDERAASTRRLLRGHARLARQLTTLPRPLSQQTLPCGTGPRASESGRAEPSARGRSGVHRLEQDLTPVRDPRADRIDVVNARLSSGRGRMCWTIRMRGPVAERVDLELLMGQESDADDGRSASWIVRLDGGRAVGLTERWAGLRSAFPLRASVRGRVVRVVVPARRVRDQVRVGEPFGWSVWSRAPDPDRPPGSTTVWIDMMPAFDTWDDLAGIRHRPRR